jgi:hypothetical protein
MRATHLLVCSCFGLALLTPESYAQRRDTFDHDGDGRISRSEWAGNNRSFNQRDRNRDGYLDRHELPPGLRDRVFGPNNADRQRQPADPEQAMGRLDKNWSGAVEGYEWPYNKRVFHELDRDRNSVLTADELSNITSATMIQLDRNNNGRIDPDEWPGGFAEFRDLDADNNGVISSEEYFNRGGEWQRRQRFSEWDSNRDGFISSTEWRSRPDLFHRLDTDRDSRLSRDEFMASTERYDNPFGWHYGDEKYRRR